MSEVITQIENPCDALLYSMGQASVLDTVIRSQYGELKNLRGASNTAMESVADYCKQLDVTGWKMPEGANQADVIAEILGSSAARLSVIQAFIEEADGRREVYLSDINKIVKNNLRKKEVNVTSLVDGAIVNISDGYRSFPAGTTVTGKIFRAVGRTYQPLGYNTSGSFINMLAREAGAGRKKDAFHIEPVTNDGIPTVILEPKTKS